MLEPFLSHLVGCLLGRAVTVLGPAFMAVEVARLWLAIATTALISLIVGDLAQVPLGGHTQGQVYKGTDTRHAGKLRQLTDQVAIDG